MFYYKNGDDMKKRIFIPILFAIILGYLCANYVLAEYNDQDSKYNIIYFLQSGAYLNKESSVDDNKDLKKVTVEENNKYYSYIGMTTNKKMAEKIKKLYEDKGIIIYIKEINIDNYDFVESLRQYDILLENSKNLDEINSVLEAILADYEEKILKI